MTPEPKNFAGSLRDLANGIANDLMPDELDVLHKAADELERLSAPEPPKGKTVRVRIACGILPDGSWYAAGASTMKDAMSIVKVFAGQSGFAHWVVADLPLPTEHTEVRGRVE